MPSAAIARRSPTTTPRLNSRLQERRGGLLAKQIDASDIAAERVERLDQHDPSTGRLEAPSMRVSSSALPGSPPQRAPEPKTVDDEPASGFWDNFV